MRKDRKKKKPSKITVSDVALVVSILALLFQFFCHVILPRVILVRKESIGEEIENSKRGEKE